MFYILTCEFTNIYEYIYKTLRNFIINNQVSLK